MSKRRNLTLTDSAAHELFWLAQVTKRSEADIMCEAVERLAGTVKKICGMSPAGRVIITHDIYTAQIK